MSKKQYKTVLSSDLTPNNIIPIYEDWKSQEKLIGYAKLNKRVRSHLDELPWVRTEIGNPIDREPQAVIFCFERWNITYISIDDYPIELTKEQEFTFRSLEGFTTNTNIAYYLTTKSNFSSFYERGWFDDFKK